MKHFKRAHQRHRRVAMFFYEFIITI